MSEIACEYRSLDGDQPVCRVVADLTERPLAECHVNDSACTYCLKCGVAPQAPNPVTASMACGVATRSGDPSLSLLMSQRMRPHLVQVPPAALKCILRGPEMRQVQCKPCQAGSLTVVMVPVFRCPQHIECTLHNTGLNPRIKACSTCEEWLEHAYPLEANPAPPPVLDQVRQARRTR